LEMLKGTDLSMIDYLMLEFHLVETYKDVPLLSDLLLYLEDYKVVAKHTTKHNWGDILMVRK